MPTMNRVELGLTNLRSAMHGPRVASLPQYLNLWSLRDGVLAGVNLDFSTVYELELENVFLMDPSRADLFEAQARAFLNSLPSGATLQFLVQIRKGDPETVAEYRRNVLTDKADALSRLITDKKCAFIEGKFIQRRRYYLFATQSSAGSQNPSYLADARAFAGRSRRPPATSISPGCASTRRSTRRSPSACTAPECVFASSRTRRSLILRSGTSTQSGRRAALSKTSRPSELCASRSL